VSPIFPVHVVVPKRLCERQHVGQRRRLGGARTRFRIIAIEQPPCSLPDTELERVAILPADRDLQHEMKVVEADGDGYFDATDDGGRHIVDLDPEPCDLGHAA
jgi:hypothetical protein